MSKRLTFEDCYSIIEKEIGKRKSFWTLNAISWMDWEDIAQNLRLHIAIKFHLWDQSRPLEGWLAAVIHNQLINATRNHYYNFAPFCYSCRAYDGENCAIYGKDRGKCPLFTHWKKTKESAYNVKLPLASVFHEQEICDIPHDGFDLVQATANIHEQMKDILRHDEYKVYSLLFIQHKNDEDAALLAFNSRFGKSRNLARLKQMKKSLIQRVKKLIYNGEMDF